MTHTIGNNIASNKFKFEIEDAVVVAVVVVVANIEFWQYCPEYWILVINGHAHVGLLLYGTQTPGLQ